mgnify:FL=1
MATTAADVFSVVEAYPDPWEPDDYPTRNIYIAATDHERLQAQQEGDPWQAPTLTDALARMRPLQLARSGVILRDDAAPLEPMVSRTTQYLRSRSSDYLPLNVHYY